VDTADFLYRAVSALRELKQPADAVVITGDLTDFGRAEEYAHLRTLIAPLTCPVYLMPGNHDDRAELRRAFPDHAYLRAAPGAVESDFIQYAADLGGVRLIAVDTVTPQASHGTLCSTRLRWLETLLAEAPDPPTILALHHPPFETFIGHMDEIGLLEGAPELARIVRANPQIQRLVCGHLHRGIQTLWAGTIAMTAPSTAHQVCLDLAADAPSAFTMEPPGCLIHAWAGDGRIVTHQAVLGNFDGPYPFFEDDGALID
jgi:3',5'-cyclic AMP phosphodiesterase CpdA